jgi:sulfur carrier protein
MKIMVNGRTKDYSGPPLLIGFLELLGIDHRAVVVERNLRIVAKSELAKEPVQDGDSLEIIRFVGGG